MALSYSKYHGSTGPDDEDFLYREDVTGPQGARYILFKEKHHTKKDLEKAKRYLKQNFDVVKIYVVKDF